KTRVLLKFDAISAAISDLGIGAAARVTANNHKLTPNAPFAFFSTFSAAIPRLASGFTGRISGNNLTVTRTSGALLVGMTISGSGLTSAKLTGQLGGTPNGDGTYTIDGPAQNVGPVPMTGNVELIYKTAPKTIYYVKTIVDPNNFTFSATPGGPEI